MAERPTDQQIRDAWDMIEGEDPDMSTEYLFARVEDYFRGMGQELDAGDISEALVPEAMRGR